MRRFGTAAAALVLAVGAAACSDSDGGDEGAESEKAEAYVDVLTERMGVAPGIPEESSRCFASAVVEGLGVDELEDRGTPEELAAEDASLGDLTMDESQAEAAYQHLGTCVDPRELMVQSIVSGMQLSDEGGTCVDDAVDEDAARESFVTGFQGSESQRASEGMQELTAAVNQCLMADMPAPPSQPGESQPGESQPSQPGEADPSTTAP